MLRFLAAAFVAVNRNLEGVRNMLLTGESFAPSLINWDHVETCVSDLEQELRELPVSLSLQEQAKRLLTQARKRDRDLVPYLITVASEISHNITNELVTHLFLLVPAELKWHYLKPEKVMGEAFESAFPDASKDAHDGIRCFVLDQWTASVFHFMRVLEHGIRHLCSLVAIPTDRITLENWKNILDQVEKQIRGMEQLPKSQEKSENLRHLSEAAANFRYFKDAWRNHVSHARTTYDSHDAKRVMDHVIDFTQQLAKRVSETSDP